MKTIRLLCRAKAIPLDGLSVAETAFLGIMLKDSPEANALERAVDKAVCDEKPAARTDAKQGVSLLDAVVANDGWKQADETPPSEFKHGPLTGQRKQLASWIMQDDDPRNLDTKLKNGIYWGRKDKRTQFSVWFKDQQRFAEANGRKLAEEQRDTNKER